MTTKKGRKLWEKLSDKIDYREISIADIAAGNSNLIQNKPQTGDRQLFYSLLERNPQKAFNKLCKVKSPFVFCRLKGKLIRIIKTFIK